MSKSYLNISKLFCRTKKDKITIEFSIWNIRQTRAIVMVPITAIHFTGRFQFSIVVEDPPAPDPRILLLPKDEGSLRLQPRWEGNGGRCATDGADEGRCRMQLWIPGSPGRARTPIIIRWTLRRLEHASIIWWIEEGRIPSSATPSPRASCVERPIASYITHSRYIRRHNIGIRAQQAPSLLSSCAVPSVSRPCSSWVFVWIAKKKSFNC